MHRHIAFASMCIGLFIAQLDIQIVSPSLNEIGGGLSAGRDGMAWLQTGYLIAEIIVVPLPRWLSWVSSICWLFTLSAGIFTLMSITCGLAQSIQIMIFFYTLQGVAGASTIPLAFTTAFIYYQGKELGLAAAVVSALASLSPTLGPTLGGWITDNLDWRWLFYTNILPGIYLVSSVPFLVNFDRPDLSLPKVANYPSIIPLVTTLGCLEYTPEEGARWGWLDNNTISLTSVLALVGFILFAARTLKISSPIVDLHAFKDKNFTLGCFFSFSGGAGIFSTVYLTPAFLGQVRGLNVEEVSFAVCIVGILQLFFVPFYFQLGKKINLQWLLMAGLGGLVLSMYPSTSIIHEWGRQELLFLQAIRGISQQPTMALIVTLTLGGIPKKRLKLASGVFNLTRNPGGAIGITLCGSISNNRTNFHFSRMGEKMVSVPHTVNDLISRSALFFNHSGSDQISETLVSTKLLSQLMLRGAQTMAFSDTFLLVSGLLLIAFLLVPAMDKSS